MTVESNYANAVATLIDWFKNLAPFYQPIREGNPKPIATQLRARFFPRYEQVIRNCDEFGLVHCAVCTCWDWSKQLLWYLFYDTQLKPALNRIVTTFLFRIVACPLRSCPPYAKLKQLSLRTELFNSLFNRFEPRPEQHSGCKNN